MVRVSFYNYTENSPADIKMPAGAIIFDSVDHTVKVSKADNSPREDWEKYDGDMEFLSLEDVEQPTLTKITEEEWQIWEVSNPSDKQTIKVTRKEENDIDIYKYWEIQDDGGYIWTLEIPRVGESLRFFTEGDTEGELEEYTDAAGIVITEDGEYYSPTPSGVADAVEVKSVIGFLPVKSFVIYDGYHNVLMTRDQEGDMDKDGIHYYGWRMDEDTSGFLYTTTTSISKGDAVYVCYFNPEAEDEADRKAEYTFNAVSVTYGDATGIYGKIADIIKNAAGDKYLTIDNSKDNLNISANVVYIENPDLASVESVRATLNVFGLYSGLNRIPSKDENDYLFLSAFGSNEDDAGLYVKGVIYEGADLPVYQKDEDGTFKSLVNDNTGEQVNLSILGINPSYVYIKNISLYSYDEGKTINDLPYNKNVRTFYCDSSKKNSDGYYHWVGCLLLDLKGNISTGEFYTTELPNGTNSLKIYSKQDDTYVDSGVSFSYSEYLVFPEYKTGADGLAIASDVKQYVDKKIRTVSESILDIESTNDYIIIEDDENAKQITANVVAIDDATEASSTITKYLVNDGADENLPFERKADQDFDYNGEHYYVYLCNTMANVGILVETPEIGVTYPAIYKDSLTTTTITPRSIVETETTEEVDGLVSALDIKNKLSDLSDILSVTSDSYIDTSITDNNLSVEAIVTKIEDASEEKESVEKIVIGTSEENSYEFIRESENDLENYYYFISDGMGDYALIKKSDPFTVGQSIDVYHATSAPYKVDTDFVLYSVTRETISKNTGLVDALDVKQYIGDKVDELQTEINSKISGIDVVDDNPYIEASYTNGTLTIDAETMDLENANKYEASFVYLIAPKGYQVYRDSSKDDGEFYCWSDSADLATNSTHYFTKEMPHQNAQITLYSTASTTSIIGTYNVMYVTYGVNTGLATSYDVKTYIESKLSDVLSEDEIRTIFAEEHQVISLDDAVRETAITISATSTTYGEMTNSKVVSYDKDTKLYKWPFGDNFMYSKELPDAVGDGIVLYADAYGETSMGRWDVTAITDNDPETIPGTEPFGYASAYDIKQYIDSKFNNIESRLEAIEAALTLK